MKRSDLYSLLAAIYTVGTFLADKPWAYFLAVAMVMYTCLTIYWTFRE